MMVRKYSKASGKKVERALHEMKEGKLRSGQSYAPLPTIEGVHQRVTRRG
jgi:hypothetical protein